MLMLIPNYLWHTQDESRLDQCSATNVPQHTDGNEDARLLLCIFVVFVTSDLKFSQRNGRPYVKQ